MLPKVPCAIWGTPAVYSQLPTGDVYHINSPRAGGLYVITGSTEAVLENATVHQKMRLTTWLCEQRAAGIIEPKIPDNTLESIFARRPLATSERLNKALLFLNDRLRIGEVLNVFFQRDLANHNDEIWAANTECATTDELLALIELLESMRLVEDTTKTLGQKAITPTAAGWLRMEELLTTRAGGTQGFVAMWFHPSTDAAYTDGIVPAIQDAGYRPLRIDNKEHSNKIDDEIVAEIKRSRFLVADFTCEEGKVRGGVYFEAGLASGLPIPIIWTCRNSSVGDLHFDTRQYNHIVWDTPENLRSALRNRIRALIGQGPLTAQ
jgi:hypothetical protein